MKNFTLSKSRLKSSLEDHNTEVFIAGFIILSGSYFQVTATTKYFEFFVICLLFAVGT